MGGKIAGSATVVAAEQDVGHDTSGSDPYWWQEAGSAVFGKTRWLLELDVEPADGAVYRVTGRFTMPNRLHKVRKILDGPPRLRPGVVLPVVIDGSDPQRLEIDWKAFKDAGGIDHLYPDEPGVVATLKGFVDELRSNPDPPLPTSPRPTATSHPPVEGVEYDTWIAATVSFIRAGLSNATHTEHCETRGFPAGRVAEVNAAWWTRVQTDPVVQEWYLYDSSHPDNED